MQAERASESTDIWLERARELLDEAVIALDVDPDDGVIGTVEAALEALKVSWGGSPSADLEDYFRDRERDPMEDCTCPPEMIARGGWQSRCPVHGR